ncbi:hypothetical protein BKP45_09995 [Anaerobacillus alkalidiazotrophicus]|uniref:NADP-dependent oxidoreductase domain-containing protein n=1 Tax=Anaerobacillus alkalidiazotrophicus TaxID=472963 RepID=A0A1S2M5Q3_9BACI|nr:hypothetical protein BKP45_09995 [Anaerobacillus alkalidiazotrophicus]
MQMNLLRKYIKQPIVATASIMYYKNNDDFQYGFFDVGSPGNEKFPKLNKKIDEVAAKYEVSNTTIAIAWLLLRTCSL